MITLETVYPCKNCQQEIDPIMPKCPLCGVEQDHTAEEHFNIFKSYRGGKTYNMVYGATILTWEDITELAEEQSGSPCFIGSFIPSQQDGANHIKILQWIPVINGQPGLNQGPLTIEITNLEYTG